MSRESVLARGRVAALAGMADTCTITRSEVTGLNQQTGAQVLTTTTVYTGACRIQQRVPAGATLTDEGQSSRQMLRRELQLPVATSGGVAVGDKVTITACVNDSDMTGRVFVVQELAGKSEATARRLGVEEAT
jgi:hypothetical protein